jgi:hypothetical protein
MRRLVDRMILAGEQAPVAFAARRGCWPGARRTQSCAFVEALRDARWQMLALRAHFDRDRGAEFDDPGEYAPLARRAVAVRARITEPF